MFYAMITVGPRRSIRYEIDVMKSEKDEILDFIQGLPDDVTTVDVLEELYFKQQVEKGMTDIVEGRVVSHEDLKRRIAKWRESAGR